MNLIQQLNLFKINNVFLSDPIKNNIINDSIFYRIIYSTPYVCLNGIILHIPLENTTIEKNYYKYKCSFTQTLYNKTIIEQIHKLELELLNSISSLCIGLQPHFKLSEQIQKESVVFFSTNKKQNIIILKISGIWSNIDSYGLTYKFMHQSIYL